MPRKKTDAAGTQAADTDANAQDGVDFEAALEELEALVEQMESGDLSLDESLKAFERGVQLTRQCQGVLQAAELKVQALTESGELATLDADDE